MSRNNPIARLAASVRQHLPAGMTLIGALLFSGVVFLLVQSWERARITADFQRDGGGLAVGLSPQDALDVDGRRWSPVLHPSPDDPILQTTWLPYGVLTGSALFSLLLAGYVATLAGRAARVNRLVARRTAELSEVNARLEEQIRERQRVEKAYDELEVRIQERTAQLGQANRDLQIEIAEMVKPSGRTGGSFRHG